MMIKIHEHTPLAFLNRTCHCDEETEFFPFHAFFFFAPNAQKGIVRVINRRDLAAMYRIVYVRVV